MKKLHFLLLAPALVLTAACQQNDAGTAEADTTTTAEAPAADPMAKGEMSMADSLPAGATPATRGFAQAMDTMNRDMMKPMSGNADRDFMMMMKAHHQGAIDMARVELEHGQNAEAKEMAQKVVTEQQAEIAEIDAWMAANPAT